VRASLRVQHCASLAMPLACSNSRFSWLSRWSDHAGAHGSRSRCSRLTSLCDVNPQGEGYYVARGLSFKEAAFEELECKLTEAQRETYDSAAKVRQLLQIVLHSCAAFSKTLIPSCHSAVPMRERKSVVQQSDTTDAMKSGAKHLQAIFGYSV